MTECKHERLSIGDIQCKLSEVSTAIELVSD